VLAQRTVERDELAGGTPAENAEVLRRVLDGERGPVRETVLLNAATALWVAEAAATLHDAYEMARASIDDGAARGALERARTA
jgi:anthranilate phosphoribosyltransferase